MANRPVYIPDIESESPRVIVKNIEFKWFPGMSKTQKQKSIISLHGEANKINISRILEISSKSEDNLGINLSAFNLMIKTRKYRRIFSVETAFQSSKKFEQGGPYSDLLDGTSLQAKKDERLKRSGNLVEFVFFGKRFPLIPRTLFYDWLYINALDQNKELACQVGNFKAFTDIEFNPKKSINCQAYSVALFISLKRSGKLAEALKSPENFANILQPEYSKRDKDIIIQPTLPWTT